jgi:glycine/D-amino acid oxidase-like deaminating enzyme
MKKSAAMRGPVKPWGLARKCEEHGVRCHWGVEVTGYDVQNGRLTKVRTDKGDIACDAAVLCAGAWAPQH